MPLMEKKRDWKKYERELGERKQKIVDFVLSRPTAEELLKELEKLNRRKKGRKFQLPKSVLLLFHFLKNTFRIDDRMLAKFLSKFMNAILPRQSPFDHSTIVKRRGELDLYIPSGITPEKLAGKTLYFDGVCLRLGRGGYYRHKRHKTGAKYLRIGVFTDDNGKVVDFTIGDEHDAEIHMIREKLPLIEKSRAKAMTMDGIGSAIDVVCRLTKSGIDPIIRASESVVESKQNAPPPEQCIREKSVDEIIWEKYVKAQEDYQKWRKETGYSMRWVFSEGVFSSFKRMHGEEVFCRTKKSIHDEVCMKFMLLEGNLPKLWA